MFGILNLNKPPGCTSRDVVNRVQRLVRPAKAGHAGTLDPLATGVLVVCIGPATRLIEYIQRMPKEYRGTFLLGRTSPSDDVELETTPIENAPIPSREAIEQALPQFIGEIEQQPPAYSAIKVQGRKAYDLARRGEQVDLATRPITIHAIEIIRYKYPELVLNIRCGSGTYVRAVGRDLAESLGTGAVMSALERTAIGEFRVADAITPEELTNDRIAAKLLPAAAAVAELPRLVLTPAEVREIRFGRTIERETPDAIKLAAVDSSGELVAILRPNGAHAWGPKTVFVDPST